MLWTTDYGRFRVVGLLPKYLLYHSGTFLSTYGVVLGVVAGRDALTADCRADATAASQRLLLAQQESFASSSADAFSLEVSGHSSALCSQRWLGLTELLSQAPPLLDRLPEWARAFLSDCCMKQCLML